MVDRIPHSRYPLGRLIALALGQKGMTRLEVVRALGYANHNRGLRRLDQHITTPDLDHHFLAKVRQVLGVETDVWQDAINETLMQVRNEAKERRCQTFRPHVFLITQRSGPRMGQITISIFAGVWDRRIISLPEDIGSWPLKRQLVHIGQKVREHYHQGDRLLTRFFGEITGYFYQAELDHGFRVTIHGEVIGKRMPGLKRAEPTLKISGKEMKVGQIEAIMNPEDKEDEKETEGLQGPSPKKYH